MKKLLIVILILALLLPAAAMADLPDISDLSQDELLQLNHAIQEKLFGQKLSEGIPVPPGAYTIGEDIPAGTYRLRIPGENGMYAIEKDGKPIGSSLVGTEYNITEIGKILLEEGTVFEIAYTTIVFYPYTGIFN